MRVRLQPKRAFAFAEIHTSGAVRFGVGTTKRGFVGLNVRDARGVIRSNMYANDDGSDTGFRTWDADRRVREKLVERVMNLRHLAHLENRRRRTNLRPISG